MKKDFFISYTGIDQRWAEWIAWQLEKTGGYSTVIQAWDFNAGGNFILEMHRAAKETDRTIAVLSSRYLKSLYTQPEWAAALVQDPAGTKRLLIPIRIEDVQPDGLLAALIYIDLAGLSESVAKDRLLKEIRQTLSSDSARPTTAPDFPSSALHSMKNEPRFPGTLPPVWNLPRRNPNFTGRVQLLEDIRESLNKEHNTALTQQALYGLGGIGKTQLAMEYAWQQSASYELVWWLRAEAPSSLIADYIALATELQLPERNESEQELVVQAMRKWLDKHQGWLLIFDNAKDAKSIRDYLPESTGGHVLITSRNQDWRAFSKPLSIEVWNRNEAIAFLQKRTGLSDENVADKLAEALGDLPLALEQAAAYIETRTKTYAEYLDLFNSRRKELWEREAPPDGYPDTIATTWSLAFDEIKRILMAKELLSLCSMAAPDTIPKSLLEKALEHYEHDAEAKVVIDSFTLDDAIAELRSYSLITPDTENISTHRLVQAVVRDRMSKDELARYRDAMIQALSDRFPDKAYENPSCCPECASLLPHAQVLLEDVSYDQDESCQERALLINNTGEYHYGRAAYADAEPLFHRALEIRQNKLGSEHLDVAYSLNNLAIVLAVRGERLKAESLFRRALGIREKQLGSEHPDVATSLDNLAGLLQGNGKYAEAEPLIRRALGIREAQLGSQHLDVAVSLVNFALLLTAKGNYAEAESLFRRALGIREKQLGSEHPDVASCLDNLGLLLNTQRNYADAEPLFRRALGIREDQLGFEHPGVASSLNNLALLLMNAKGNFIEAEPLFRRALVINEKQLGSEHPYVATCLNNLAIVQDAKGKSTEAKSLYRRALEIREKKLGLEHPDVAISLNNLAGFLKAKGKYTEAEPLYRRAMEIRENQLGAEHPDVAQSLSNLAVLLEMRKKFTEAKLLYRRALRIMEKTLGKNHPSTVSVRKNCARLHIK